MIVKLKKQRRKLQHITLLKARIAELHDNIFQRALSGKKPEKIEASKSKITENILGMKK